MSVRSPRLPRSGGHPLTVDPAAALWYAPGFLGSLEATALLRELSDGVVWGCEHVTMFGTRRAVPRLVSWCGDPGIDYRYSGVPHPCDGWRPALAALKARLAAELGVAFNFVLLNRYRGGSDHMGWHADDESQLGPAPVIASVSLGATRRFRIRARRQPGESIGFDLEHGSLLLMWGDGQRRYQHCVTRTRRPVGERINLTFREVLN